MTSRVTLWSLDGPPGSSDVAAAVRSEATPCASATLSLLLSSTYRSTSSGVPSGRRAACFRDTPGDLRVVECDPECRREWPEPQAPTGGRQGRTTRRAHEHTFATIMYMREEDIMRATDIGMVPLGYGRFVRADEIVALVPIEDGRGSGRRTYVHVAGLATRSWLHDRKGRSSPT